MGLSSAGIGSNLPIDSIITQLMAVEQQPLTNLDKKVTTFQAKLSAMGTLKAALATFQTAAQGLSSINKFQAVSTTVGDPAVASASGSATANQGTYSLEVSKLAQAQKLVAAGQVSSSAPIGAGTITFDLGTISGGTLGADGKYTGAGFASSGAALQTVTIDPANTSLSGIRDAINKAKVGVTASIVNDGTGAPYRLVLTETASGNASSMKISVGGGDPALTALLSHDPGPTGTQSMSEIATAQNAEFKLDGLKISSATNSASNVIDGLTLNLTKTNVGNPTNIVVARDTATVVASVGAFVSAYNAINKTVSDLTAYNPATKVAGVLNGDATARSIQAQLRGLLTSPIAAGGSAFSVLSDVGVSVKSGVMSVDDAKLKKSIDSNFSDIAALFAAVGKPSDSLVAFSGASAKTIPGAYAVDVTQAAARGMTAGSSAHAPITASNNTLTVLLDGVSSAITLGTGPYADDNALAAEVQSKINGASAFSAVGSSVTVTQSGGKFTITSNRWGSGSTVSVAADPAGIDFMGAAATTSAGADVAGTIGGFAATGSGRTLTAAAGNPTEGLALLIDGAVGSRGTVNYSQGYAYQFDRLAGTLLDTSAGPLSTRTEGLNASIKSLAASRLRLTDRLADTEKRYRAQYTKLDSTISSMNATSSYLTQQLAALAKL